MNRRSTSMITALVFLIPIPALGQHVEHGFEHQLFPPDLVKQHQAEIEVTAEQRVTITEAIKRFQEQVVETQWLMDEEQAKLGRMLETPTADEAQVLAQMDRVLDLEVQVKRAHFTMLVRIKNALTAEQQKRLTALHLRHTDKEEAARHDALHLKSPHPPQPHEKSAAKADTVPDRE